MDVRAAEAGDLPGVLWLQFGVTEVTPAHRATWARMMGTADLTVYVAEADRGEIVGTTCLLVLPNLGYDCRPTAFLEPMVVAEPYRRRGVGRMLVERLLADARAQGCHKIQVVTHKRHADDGAHEFYRSLGFGAEAEGFRLYLDS